MGIVNHHVRNKRTLSLRIADQLHHKSCGLVLSAMTLLAIIVWSYQRVILSLYKEWQKNPDYSIGLLVPFIAIFLLWYERKTLKKCQLRPSWLWGVILLILAQAARIVSLLFFYQSGQRYSLVLTIAGLVLMVCGWQVFRRVIWILLILFLMVPTPTRVQNLINGPLQNFATTASVFFLEAFGVEITQKGNIVMLNETTPMGVTEACGGLRMLTAFIIVTASITYLMKCSRPRKVVLMLSSIPIALMCNIVRLCLTAALILLVSVEVGYKFFHDFAGLAMMPIAVLLLFAELWLMDKIVGHPPSPQHGQVSKHSKSTTKNGVKRMRKKKAEPVIIRKN
ncbi:MAG: exosortase/archaeosortase family protein [Sedimentisphaerales bacterium]|nr:exosortase/archaeosortase family protein [Sedimentisphaerales bacterium]